MALKRKDHAVRCAGCHLSGPGVEVRTDDESALSLGWVILPPGWMVGSTHDDWEDDLVCSESCLLKATSRQRGVEVASEIAAFAKAKKAWGIVTSARARDTHTFCSHCQEQPIDEALNSDRGDWCSTECQSCKGQACPHFDAHVGRVQGEHADLCEEVDRLRRENATLRGDIKVPEDDREMETVAAEILALDGRATQAPWGEKCGALKHYVFSKDSGEDFGASLQEMHWQDGRIVPAHDNGSLIAFYRNYAPALARSWSVLWRKTLCAAAVRREARGALRSADEILLVLCKKARTKEPICFGPDSLAYLNHVIERVWKALMVLDAAAKEET